MRKLVIVALLGAMAGASTAQQPVAASGPWMVFFDWGKPDVRGDDQAVLDQVAAEWRTRPSAHLLLTGHTDRSGNAAVNRSAGLRRAEMVRGELEKRGVPRNAIAIASLGESQPLVATEDGVREVQNRRVMIEFKE